MNSRLSAWVGNGNGRRASSAAPPSSNPTEAPDRNTRIQLSKEDLMKRACNFEEFSSPAFAPGVTVRDGLANMEDLVAYGVSEPVQKQLWEEEITRLTTAVGGVDVPINFAGSDDFKLDSKEAHESLAGLADKLLVAFNIVINDSQGALLKHMPDLTRKDEIIEKTRQRLERFVAHHIDEDEKDGEGRDARLGTLNINHADYFELVNYVTATIARMLCKAASSKLWHGTILAKSAKIAAKMKVVSTDLREHAETSLQNSPPAKRARNIGLGAAMDRNADQARGIQRQNMLEDLEGILGMMDSKESQPSFEDNTAHQALTRLYFLNEDMVQHSLFKIYQYVFMSLRGTNNLRTALSTSYEICAMLYKTGYRNFPVFLFQDIDGEYLGSSSDEKINVSHASFQVANLAVEGLANRRQLRKNNMQSDNGTAGSSANGRSPDSAKNTTAQPASPSNPSTSNIDTSPPPSPNDPKSVDTTIDWFYTAQPGSSASGPKRMRLNTMSDVITVMVPLTLVSPIVVKRVTKFFEVFSFMSENIEGEKTVLYRPTEFKASFCLGTAEYRKMWADQPGRGYVSQLSASLVARDTLLSLHPDRQNPRRVWTMDMELPTSEPSHEERERELREEQQQIQHSLKQFEQASKRMKEWIFEENGVRVRCDWYVGAVSAAATVLVLGGMAAGIMIGERLPGVDPFNITTFSWVLAAFIILIAKSVRVASWSWWDFLHRQVLCRSVSELSAVTGIEDQLILARLLQEESGTPFQTRGPYNTVFSSKASGGDGFSIDQPLNIRTMLLSGLIMIQVQSIYHGSFLVCLDLRRGTEANAVFPSWRSVEVGEDRIVSDRLIDEPSKGTMHRIILKKKNIAWGRTIGVYGRKDAVFC